MSAITDGGKFRAFAWLAAATGLLVAAALLVAPGVSAGPTETEMVKLDPTADEGWNSGASGQVKIWQKSDQQDSPEGVSFSVSYSGMSKVRYNGSFGAGTAFYALYVTTPSTGRQVVGAFNVSEGGQFSNWSFMPGDPTSLMAEDMVFEVWLEFDDGVASPDKGVGFDAWKVLEGHLDRP